MKTLILIWHVNCAALKSNRRSNHKNNNYWCLQFLILHPTDTMIFDKILVLIHILIISVKLECMYFIHCLSYNVVTQDEDCEVFRYCLYIRCWDRLVMHPCLCSTMVCCDWWTSLLIFLVRICFFRGAQQCLSLVKQCFLAKSICASPPTHASC